MEKQHQVLVKRISFKTILFAILFILSILIFTILAHEVVGENEDRFDIKVFEFVNAHFSDSAIQFFSVISFFGTPMFLIPAYLLMVIYLFMKKHKEDAIDVAIISLTSTALLTGLKSIFERSRPDLPLLEELTNYSFPSGHALSSFIFCSVLIYLTWKSDLSRIWKWSILVVLLFLTAIIGISRIVLRYHFASDVAAGFCMGFVWVMLCIWIKQKLRATK